MSNDIQRFVDAQHKDYAEALLEIKQGCKRSHWMWYIFPQIHGLGYSEISKFYAINNIEEVRAYLKNKYLYNNLINICQELLKLDTNNPIVIFGQVDAMKLKSSMTLFNYICDLDKTKIKVFSQVLDKYFEGERDTRTINIIRDEIYSSI